MSGKSGKPKEGEFPRDSSEKLSGREELSRLERVKKAFGDANDGLEKGSAFQGAIRRVASDTAKAVAGSLEGKVDESGKRPDGRE